MLPVMFVQLSFSTTIYVSMTRSSFQSTVALTLAGLFHWPPTLRRSAACIEIEAIAHMQLEILL